MTSLPQLPIDRVGDWADAQQFTGSPTALPIVAQPLGGSWPGKLGAEHHHPELEINDLTRWGSGHPKTASDFILHMFCLHQAQVTLFLSPPPSLSPGTASDTATGMLSTAIHTTNSSLDTLRPDKRGSYTAKHHKECPLTQQRNTNSVEGSHLTRR